MDDKTRMTELFAVALPPLLVKVCYCRLCSAGAVHLQLRGRKSQTRDVECLLSAVRHRFGEGDEPAAAASVF